MTLATTRAVLGGKRWMCLRGNDAVIADSRHYHTVMANSYYTTSLAAVHQRVPGLLTADEAVHAMREIARAAGGDTYQR